MEKECGRESEGERARERERRNASEEEQALTPTWRVAS
jgi:hypothetical protein